jgi:hypothetical protein
MLGKKTYMRCETMISLILAIISSSNSGSRDFQYHAQGTGNFLLERKFRVNLSFPEVWSGMVNWLPGRSMPMFSEVRGLFRDVWLAQGGPMLL